MTGFWARHLCEGGDMRQASWLRGMMVLLSSILLVRRYQRPSRSSFRSGKTGLPAKAYRAQPERPVTGHEADGWIENVNDPSLTVYLPAEGKATGSAIVVAPGGGHRFLAASHEGQDVGRWLAEHGIVGAVLKYRLYRQVGSPYRRGDAIADGERAVRIVRSRR